MSKAKNRIPKGFKLYKEAGNTDIDGILVHVATDKAVYVFIGDFTQEIGELLQGTMGWRIDVRSNELGNQIVE